MSVLADSGPSPVSEVVSTSTAVSYYQQPGQRLPERWSTITSTRTKRPIGGNLLLLIEN